MDWRDEWLTSLEWIAKAFGITVVCFFLAAWLLTRYTKWGRQFRQITIGYFIPGRSWLECRGLVTVLGMLLLCVLDVRIAVLITYSSNGMYTALQEMNSGHFWYYIAVFAVLAAIYVVETLLTYLLAQTFIIHWRIWLNARMVGDWLDRRAYHRGHFVDSPVDNPDQRIQEDITTFTTDSQTLAIGSNNNGLGATSAIITLVSFTTVLWNLSGPMTILGVHIPRMMVFLAFIYVIIASAFAFKIGRPLIRLNFLNEGLGASYRYALVRLRDNSEEVAFYRGEDVERSTLLSRFGAVIKNQWRIVFRETKFQGFNLTVSQIAVVFPLMIQAPRFFAGTIKLGDVTQTSQAFTQVHNSLSFFRNIYDTFAAYRATLNRLSGLLDADEQSRALPELAVQNAEGLTISGLDVRLPDDRPLIADLDVDLTGGDSLLVKGPSGSGKTTLLRSLAGLWPYTSGVVRHPDTEHTMFLSQQPYVPLGTVRMALSYPDQPAPEEDTRAREVLRKVQLAHLEEHIDEERHWARVLSPGEQQRLGFARILLRRPKLVFLDEATSAVDEGLEHSLYTAVRTELPDTMLVSVGHRSTLGPFHNRQLELLGEGRWEVTAQVR
ncbi:ABC transporter ATP-binding protein/permease [Rhodococcus sp. D2-41]|uniref:ABC transporter ATP-binding protein/permease n=1 Tax=Speluncibacter jeojiensis TaxID=2710754 RepID=UPI00385185C7|nr:ABC transporter ATP-binding protein/permease [Rhodococcus sp. D2-41]